MNDFTIKIDEDIEAIIDALADKSFASDFNAFEQSFITTMQKAVEKKWKLTIPQLKTLYRIYKDRVDPKFDIPEEHWELFMHT